MENQIDNTNEIDLTSIDWNKLSIDEFHKLEQKLQSNKKLSKDQKPKEKRNSGYVPVILKGKTYMISEVTHKRLKTMKSSKSKEKLINEIILGSNPLQEL
jgi:hypothetical protein